ncbi:MAG: TetR/AcrR family transcriptional regulator [Actinomycetia bacterium]|nr:TetR/AcrR family transcriptional regulator [Actinomycetes bacterium]
MSTVVENAEGHVLDLRAKRPSRWATRDRILLEASRPFATHGFRGASTRQTAEQVGIRQPSLFKHFPSKRAMLAELAVYDMDVPARHAEVVARTAGSAVDRLAGYVAWDLEWYRTMPFDLRGMTEDLVRSGGLILAQEALARWRTAVTRMLEQGVEPGEFAAHAVPFVPIALETLSWHMVNSKGATERTVDDAVDFLLAAVLTSSRDVRRR